MLMLPDGAPGRALYDASRSRWWSFPELRQTVQSLSDHLAGPARALVFHLCRTDVPGVLLYLAAVEAGNAVALLDPEMTDGQIRELIRLYRPECVVLAPHRARAMASLESYALTEPQMPGGEIWKSAEAGGEIHSDLGVLLSTSGSTGSPKLVRLSLANLAHNTRAIVKALALRPEDRAVGHLPLHYSYGLSVVNTHLSVGGSVVLTDGGVTESEFWSTVEAERCTTLPGVPYHYEIVLRLARKAIESSRLSTLTQAGGRLDDSTIRELHDWMTRRNGRFFVMYGQTESSPRITILPAEDLPVKLGSVGLPLEGSRIEIVADSGLAAPSGQVGEVVCHGPSVMMGYATNREDLAFGDCMNGRLPTGDLGRLDEDGYLFIVGRRKRISKALGRRISLDEVEAILRRHATAAVVEGDNRLVVFTVSSSSAVHSAMRDDLHTQARIPSFALEFRSVEALPLMASGKVDYARLERLV